MVVMVAFPGALWGFLSLYFLVLTFYISQLGLKHECGGWGWIIDSIIHSCIIRYDLGIILLLISKVVECDIMQNVYLESDCVFIHL